MLNLKKNAEPLHIEEIKVETCPVCQSYVCHAYFMQDSVTKQKSRWFSCSCGVIFNSKKPTKVYDKAYWDKHNKESQKDKDSFEYPVRLYAPIIEELIYGRRVLIVGRNNKYQEEALAKRGWVPTIIDKNISLEPTDNLICADFETYQFPENQKYGLIWIYHTLECFSYPIGSLELCKNLLTEDGIIMLSGVDTDFVNTRSSSCFIHWKHDENYLMWNRRSLTSHLEKLGFNVIMARQNYEHRFPYWDDLHLIAQRKFF